MPGAASPCERVPDYWGADIPVNKGRNNFDEIRYEYYRDPNVALEAFKAGRFDLRVENSSRFWATGYQGPALDKGLITKLEIPTEGGTGMQGFVFNTRRDKFKDPLVRAGPGLRVRLRVDQQDAVLRRLYADRELLRQQRAGLVRACPGPTSWRCSSPTATACRRRCSSATTSRRSPTGRATTGTICARPWPCSSRRATRSRAASWSIPRPASRSSSRSCSTRAACSSASSARSPSPWSGWAIKVDLRTVDDAQYQKRIETFDFDMITGVFGQSLSPGNEQREFWGSAAADTPGSRNVIGVKDPIVDELIDKIITAHSREDLIAACRALDRVLLWSHYVIPQWHNQVTRIAFWDKLDHPDDLAALRRRPVRLVGRTRARPPRSTRPAQDLGAAAN